MNKSFLEKYEKVKFTDEQLPLFYSILQTRKKLNPKDDDAKYITVFDIFRLIVNNSKPGMRGITKAEIQDNLHISRKVCDDIITLLQGATVIQYEDDAAREQPYTVTERGMRLSCYHQELVDIEKSEENKEEVVENE